MRPLFPRILAAALPCLAACSEPTSLPVAPMEYAGGLSRAAVTQTFSAGFGSAVIDGQLAPAEWTAATAVDFTLNTLGDAHESTLYVMNDDTYLYLALVVRNEDFAPGNAVQGDVLDIYFDNDNDGSIAYSSTFGDDFVQVNAPFDGGFWDGFTCQTPCEFALSFQRDELTGGTSGVVAAFTHSNPTPGAIGTYVFEVRKSLRSGDIAQDFQLSPGDAVGIFLEFIDTPIGEPGGTPASWPGPDCFSTVFGGPPCEGATIILSSAALPVTIDIKPGSSVNAVQAAAGGVIPAAVLTTPDFNARDVDGATLTLSSPRASAPALRWSLEDVDGDGDEDLIAHFATSSVGLQCGDDSATLAGMTTARRRIVGSDAVTVVPCH